jgi:hypothetical protein
MDAQITTELHFGHFIHTSKDNEITFLMKLVPYQNSSKLTVIIETMFSQ